MTKWVHREAMRGILPRSIVERKSKATFPESRHFDAIRAMLEQERGNALQPLVNSDNFAKFLAQSGGPKIDDSTAWLYWSCYMATSFLRHSLKD